MGDGIEQRGAQAFAFASSFGKAKLFDGSRALDGHGNEGLARKHGARDTQTADGTDAKAKRNEANAVGHIQERLIPNDDGLQSFEVELRNHRAGAVDFLFFGEQERGGANFENIHDLVGNAVQQLNDVTGFEQPLAERIEFFDFAAAGGSIFGFLASARR